MPRLLIAYDGSAPSRSAVRAAAGLFPGADATALFVYEHPPSFERVIVHSGTADPALVQQGIDELTEETTARATTIAAQGAALANEHRLVAAHEIVPTKGG